jgi:hypothetical protein
VHVCVVARRVDLDVGPSEVHHLYVERGTGEAEFTEDWERVKWVDETDA